MTPEASGGALEVRDYSSLPNMTLARPPDLRCLFGNGVRAFVALRERSTPPLQRKIPGDVTPSS